MMCAAPEVTLTCAATTWMRGKVGEFGSAVYCGNVKKLELHRHGRKASVSVGTMTVNGC